MVVDVAVGACVVVVPVGQAADVRHALLLELSPERRLQERVRNHSLLGDERRALAVGGLAAAKPQVLHAVSVVRHLMVVVEPSLSRSTDLIDVRARLQGLALVRTALIPWLLSLHGSRVLLHLLQRRKTGVAEMDNPMLRVNCFHLLDHGLIRCRAKFASSVHRELICGYGVVPWPPLWFNHGREAA